MYVGIKHGTEMGAKAFRI